MSWTDERIKLLTKLWAEGLSAAQIATELGGVTRNAVLGKVHRLGLSGKSRAPKTPTTTQKQEREKKRLEKAKAREEKKEAAAPKKPPQKAPVRPSSLAGAPLIPSATVLQLSEKTCKWPIGDPQEENFHFCARHSEAGTPYCGYHARIAYQPIADRRRARRARAAE